MFFMRKKHWWPIIVGTLFALIEVFSFYLSERPLGASRGFTTVASILEYVFFPKHFETVDMWKSYTPVVEWTMAVVAGIVLGSFISSVASGEFKISTVPDMWKTSKGSSVVNRWYWAVVGGVLLGFGSRMAMGCTLGMLISGVVQLAPAGFIFMMSLWVGGVGMTLLFYRLGTLTLKRG
jgi:hypothetical protein